MTYDIIERLKELDTKTLFSELKQYTADPDFILQQASAYIGESLIMGRLPGKIVVEKGTRYSAQGYIEALIEQLEQRANQTKETVK